MVILLVPPVLLSVLLPCYCQCRCRCYCRCYCQCHCRSYCQCCCRCYCRCYCQCRRCCSVNLCCCLWFSLSLRCCLLLSLSLCCCLSLSLCCCFSLSLCCCLSLSLCCCLSWVARAIIRTYIWNSLSGSHQANVSNKIYVPRVLVELLEIRLLVQGCRRPSSVDIACAWPLSVFTDASGCAWTSCQCHTIALLVLFHSTRRGSSSVSQ